MCAGQHDSEPVRMMIWVSGWVNCQNAQVIEVICIQNGHYTGGAGWGGGGNTSWEEV